jgi:uncharacterized protein
LAGSRYFTLGFCAYPSGRIGKVPDEAKMRFALDSSLGKLAKWLRILGFDSIYVPGKPKESFLIYGKKGRFLLTRARRIQIKNPGHPLLFIDYNDPREQLQQVISDLKVDFSDIKPFSRCIRCNLSLGEISRNEVRTVVPDYVYETQVDFLKCPGCGRIYWSGTHVSATMNAIREIFGVNEIP